jgi:CHASE3 domain sensor protein
MGMWDKAKQMFQGAKKKAKDGKDKTKAFAMKKMMKSQMKDLPKAKREKMEQAIDDNPDLFQDMSKEIKEKMDNGQNQMSAMMEVSKKYRSELQKLMQ